MDEPLACDKIGILRQGKLIMEDTPERILSIGQTQVSIEMEGQAVTETVADYQQELPRILSRYGLFKSVSRIRLKPATLEEVFVKLLRERMDDD